MRGFRPYVDRLGRLLVEAWHGQQALAQVPAALDGEPARELKRLVALPARRTSGAFFTGSELAAKTARLLAGTFGPNSIVLDPACGAGDLLLACTDVMPAPKNLRAALAAWNGQLVGRDIHRQFVRATKIRLALKALTMFGQHSATPPDVDELFSQLQVGSGRSDVSAYQRATHIILNPPFGLVTAPDDCSWGKGLVTEAALFLDTAVSMARSGTHLVAVLPDVLRSGSRYAKWRTLISRRACIASVAVHGLFDDSADVDVFILHLITTHEDANQGDAQWTSAAQSRGPVLSDLFEVSVGAVVDFRDAHKGPWRPYVVAKSLPMWCEVPTVVRKRRFNKRVFTPPFVVVRRMSRPGNTHRAVATLIRGSAPVAVDNHLMALVPRDGSLKRCQELLRLLPRPDTDAWLDNRIRCRHLTVTALRELPCPFPP